MFKFNVKWTTAQSSLGHFVISLLVSIVMGVLAACAQYLYSGTFNPQELAVIASAAFIAAFSRGIISLESNPNLMPSLLDAMNELKTLVIQQPSIIAPQQPTGPLVVQHITQLPESANVTPQPSVRQLNAVPPRPIVQPPIQMPQAVPAVDVAALTTQQQQVVPQVPFERSFSMPMAAVQPGQ
jgi:hypothetical protein